MLLLGMPKKYQPDFPFLRAIPTSRVITMPIGAEVVYVPGSPLHWSSAALFCHPLADPDIQANLHPLPHHARPPYWNQKTPRLCLHPKGVKGLLHTAHTDYVTDRTQVLDDMLPASKRTEILDLEQLIEEKVEGGETVHHPFWNKGNMILLKLYQVLNE